MCCHTKRVIQTNLLSYTEERYVAARHLLIRVIVVVVIVVVVAAATLVDHDALLREEDDAEEEQQEDSAHDTNRGHRVLNGVLNLDLACRAGVADGHNTTDL